MSENLNLRRRFSTAGLKLTLVTKIAWWLEIARQTNDTGASANGDNLVLIKAEGSVFEALRQTCLTDWQAYTDHSFVIKLADGSLPVDCFQHYLIQLYLWSKNYVRSFALAVVKSEHLDDMREAATHIDILLNYEMALHVEYCATWGISQEALDNWQEDDANQLYSRYVLDKGLTGDLLDLLVALTPCSLGYAEIGAKLMAHPDTIIAGNPYRRWLELHGGLEFQESALAMRKYLDRVAARRGVSCEFVDNERWQSLCKNFSTASQLEVKFWEMGLNPPLLNLG